MHTDAVWFAWHLCLPEHAHLVLCFFCWPPMAAASELEAAALAEELVAAQANATYGAKRAAKALAAYWAKKTNSQVCEKCEVVRILSVFI